MQHLNLPENCHGHICFIFIWFTVLFCFVVPPARAFCVWIKWRMNDTSSVTKFYQIFVVCITNCWSIYLFDILGQRHTMPFTCAQITVTRRQTVCDKWLSFYCYRQHSPLMSFDQIKMWNACEQFLLRKYIDCCKFCKGKPNRKYFRNKNVRSFDFFVFFCGCNVHLSISNVNTVDCCCKFISFVCGVSAFFLRFLFYFYIGSWDCVYELTHKINSSQ